MKSYSPFQTFCIYFFLLLITPDLFSQEEKLKDVFVEAESYFLFEEYKDALPLYQRMLVNDPENFNINFKIGICYLNDVYQVSKSVPYLEKAAEGMSAESKTTSYKERKAPMEALYYLGNAYRVNNRLEEAVETYEKFKKVLDPAVYDAALVDEQIKACRIASEQQKSPMYFISSNLGEGINDRFEEINPVISGDEKVLVFTRKLQFYDAVFYSRRQNGVWSEPLNLTPFFAVDGNTYSTGISYDGDELFVYRSDNFDGNLYVSKYKGGKWLKLEKLNGNINTKYWESSATLSKDGRTLYFTSNREGGYGGLDIYKSERTRGGDWGPAMNLGPVINTRYNEDTPFLTEDGKTIYFSSMGHYNMGGYDIFYSTRLDNGQWAKPVNAGYPLNTTGDDMFFVPVHDGAYAYYSRYDPNDTYGMTDIYKLEVFTALHPRKFILNGITRVEGQMKPDYSQLTAVLIQSKTGKMIDQTRLENDGSYSLNALSGEFDLHIRGNGINEKIEKIMIPVDNPSNIVAHSSLLTAATTSSEAEQTAGLARQETKQGPQMTVSTLTYDVTTNENIPIRLDLERDTKLKVVTLLDGKPLRTEFFDIKKRKFIYMLTPSPGINTLRFTLTNMNGDSTVQEVTIHFLPPSEEMSPVSDNKFLSDSNRYAGVTGLSQGNLRDFLETLDLSAMHFKTAGDLYDYLTKNADEHGYLMGDVDELMKRFLSQKDLNVFYDELSRMATDSLAKTLKQTSLRDSSIYTSEALLNYLYQHSNHANYNLEELRQTLYAIAAVNRNPDELIRLLESYSSGKLKVFLGEMLLETKQYTTSTAVADQIMKGAVNNEFPLEELDSTLRLAATDINLHFLMQSLIFISSPNLKQTLLELNVDKQNIRNSSELISYLLENASTRNYSKRELIENIEKIRRDPYYYVDLFRKMLAEKASGSLKKLLEDLNIRELKLNTYEDLIDYLLNQSRFHDYNREMVYQLLIDIINPRNVSEFIDLLKRYADPRIVNALKETGTGQFSKPIEVMQYLLSVADEFSYTERDLLRTLLKILLEKGTTAGSLSERNGWFSGIDKPGLITTLVVVNSIIIILLIIYFVRKKRRNE